MESQNTSRSWKWAHALIVALFMLFVWLPLIDSIFGLDPTPDHEGIPKRPAPEFLVARETIKRFPERYEAFYNTHFGFRNSLIMAQNLLRLRLLRPHISGDVILGKEGWLFLNENETLESFRGTLPLFTEEELDRWHRLFKARHDRLAEMGIRYLVLLVPNKHTVYPEFMPDGFNQRIGKRRLDQLVEYLEAHADYEFIDFRNILFEGKKTELTYSKTDTHWNQFGSRLACAEIMEKLKPWFPETSFFKSDDLSKSERNYDVTGLLRMLGLQRVISESGIFYSPGEEQAVNVDNSEILATFPWEMCPAPKTYLHADTNLPDMMIIGDSFCEQLVYYLKECFHKTVFVWHHFNYDHIEAEKPAIVINEIAQRFVQPILPEHPEEIEDIYVPYKTARTLFEE